MERILKRTIAVRREVTIQSKGSGKYDIMRTLMMITLWLTVWFMLPQNGGDN